MAGADFNAIGDHLRTASPLLLILATSVLFILVIPQSMRWWSIIKVSGAPFEYRAATGITLIGWFFNQVLPSSVGGDALRVWYASRYGVSLSTATQSVVYDRISALIAVTLLLLLSTPWLRLFFSSNEPIISILVFVFILVMGCLFLMTADKTVSFIFPVACVMWLLALSMQIPLDLIHTLPLMPVILFITAIPISIAGWGGHLLLHWYSGY